MEHPPSSGKNGKYKCSTKLPHTKSFLNCLSKVDKKILLNTSHVKHKIDNNKKRRG